ncbi:MAG: RNA 2',3'-cyclic phosphodiesterase [Woeseia sp.]
MDKRVFFGLWPSERQREALRDPIKAAVGGLEGDLTLRGNWHVTLVFLGAMADARIADLAQAASAIEVEPFRVRLDRLEYWPRPRIACLLATSVPPALLTLQQQLETLAITFGHAPEEHVYRPHLTVARNTRPFVSARLAQPIMLEWSGFELLESVSGSRGLQYSPLKQGGTDNS